MQNNFEVLDNFIASNSEFRGIGGFNCSEWMYCKEIYDRMKHPDSPAEYVAFGSAGAGYHVWSLYKSADQSIYLIEMNYGLWSRKYEKLNDESMKNNR